MFEVFRRGPAFSLSHFSPLGHSWDMPRRAAREWRAVDPGLWTPVGPNFVRARTISQTVLPLGGEEFEKELRDRGRGDVGPGRGERHPSSRVPVAHQQRGIEALRRGVSERRIVTVVEAAASRARTDSTSTSA